MELANARWFAVDLHVPERRFGMLQLDDDQVGRASFLDTRLDAPIARAAALPVARVASAKLPRAPIAWLFHTSFCASTLLARALHVPPFAFALKEPLVLRRLSDARHAGWKLDGLIAPTIKMLGRPWHPGGAVVIKPTHVALNVAEPLLAAAPASRAVILTSSLDDFLISNLKKSPESRSKIPVLVERALRTTAFGDRLPPAGKQPPDPVCAAGLQWAAQREHVLDLVTKLGPTRIRALSAEVLLADVVAGVAACARWLQLAIPDDALAAHTREEARRNAKQLDAPYGPAQRAHEAATVTHHYGDALASARAWLDAHVLPAMRPAARSDPPPWPG